MKEKDKEKEGERERERERGGREREGRTIAVDSAMCRAHLCVAPFRSQMLLLVGVLVNVCYACVCFLAGIIPFQFSLSQEVSTSWPSDALHGMPADLPRVLFTHIV